MDDALGWTLRLMIPGAICLCSGVFLQVVAALRHRRPSVWGMRLVLLGFALAVLVPGVAILVSFTTGKLQLPAVIVGAVLITYGVRFLAQLRRVQVGPPK